MLAFPGSWNTLAGTSTSQAHGQGHKDVDAHVSAVTLDPQGLLEERKERFAVTVVGFRVDVPEAVLSSEPRPLRSHHVIIFVEMPLTMARMNAGSNVPSNVSVSL